MNLNLDDLLKGKGPKLYKRAQELMPGGTQLFSKRQELFAPDVWPTYFSKSKGTRVWDLDGREYLDMSIMGIGACILGYGDEDVDNAVINAVRNGVASSLNCPEEIELAEMLISLHPWAERVRYMRSGGEAMAAAVRIARAQTGRDLVMFSGYHGWADWYLAANLGDENALDGQLLPGLQPRGIPRVLKGSALPFFCNDIEQLKTAASGREKEIGAIVIEPARGEDAPKGYLEALRAYASKIGAVLIFDEITTGFRMCPGGIHLKYGVNPDLAVFAKCMANGYAMAAVIGTKEAMDVSKDTFISSTNWTERIGPTAAIATIRKYIQVEAHKHIIDIGKKSQEILRAAAAAHKLNVKVSGIPTLPAFQFENDKDNMKKLTYFTVEMARRGILAFRQFKPSYAHSAADLEKYRTNVHEVFQQIASTHIDELLTTPPASISFHRLTKE